MNQEIDLSTLLRLRKVTRAVSEHFRHELNSHLLALQPLFHPVNLLGEHVRNAPKRRGKTADAALSEMRALYERVARRKPFRFDDELRPPLDVFGAAAEINPVTYSYTPKDVTEATPITVTCPLKWVLSYKGLGPGHLRELLGSTSGTARMELQTCLLHNLLMHLLLGQQIGVASILRGLRNTVSTEFVEPLGGLPMCYISAAVGTILPSDETIIESTELTGATVFEEIVDIASVLEIKDPIRETSIELIQGFGDDLLKPQ